MKKRVVLKLSGEALAGKTSSGIDLEALFSIAQEIKKAHRRGVQIAVVVGGGNIWRGARGKGRHLERVISDNMGMIATVVNALALQDALEQSGVPTRVQSAIEMAKVAEGYIRRRAIRHLEKDRVVIFAAGTGNPYFSTDTAAVLRAVEIDAHKLLKATHVDGVYTADPRTSKTARRLPRLTLSEALRRKLGFMDATALSLCQENRIPLVVFNLHKKGNIQRAIAGESLGTLLMPC